MNSFVCVQIAPPMRSGFPLQGSRGPNWTPGIPAGPLICSVGVQYIHHQISDTDTVSQGLGAKVEISYFLIPPSKKIKIFYKS